jgi:hypothetical protein
MTVNTKDLDPKLVTAEPIVCKGAKFRKHLKVYLNEIYVPAMSNNVTRKNGKDPNNVNDLKQALSKGIKYHLMPPVIRKKQIFANGKRYDYELIAGNHRFEALKDNNFKEWIFSLYEFGVGGVSEDSSIKRFCLKENDHVPQLNASAEDIINIVLGEIADGVIGNDKYSIQEYVNDVCQNARTAMKTEIVKKIMASAATYQDVTTYTAPDAKQWAEDEGYVAGGYDEKRDENGWSVLDTRYISKYTMTAITNYADTGKQSYFMYHTMAPSEGSSLNTKRKDMIKAQKRIDDAIFKLVEFVNENKRLPWYAIGFLPQDRKANEKGLIKIA